MRAGIAVGAVVIAAALAGCGVSGSSSAAGQDASASAAVALSKTPLGRCVGAVTRLLLQTQVAVDEGYSDGINLQQVMEQYGVDSAVWRSFYSLDAQELRYFIEHGTSGAPPQMGQVGQECKANGA